MVNRKPKKHKKHKPTKESGQSQQSGSRSIQTPRSIFGVAWRITLGVVGFFATLLGAAASAYYFLPALDISLDSQYSYDLFSQPFIVTNNSPFSLYDIELMCALMEIRGERFSASHSAVERGDSADELARGESISTRCGIHLPASDLFYADIVISASFRPPLIWRKYHKGFRFVAERESNGEWHWFPRPLKKPDSSK